MKKYFLFVAFLFFLNSKDAFSQLEVVWQKTIPGGNANFSPDGKWLYFSENKKIRKYDAMTGELISTFDTTGSYKNFDIINLKLSKTGNYLNSNFGLIWEVKKEIQLPIPDITSIGYMDISNDDYLYIARASYNEIVKYDLINRKTISTTKLNYPPFFIRFSNTGKYFIVTTEEEVEYKVRHKRIYLWDALEMKEIGILQDFVYSGSGNYQEIKFSNDDKYISLVFDNTKGYILDLKLAKTIKRLDLSDLYINSIDVLPNNQNYLVSYFDANNTEKTTLEYFDFKSKINTYLNGGYLLSFERNNEVFILNYNSLPSSLYKQVKTGITNLEVYSQIDCSYINNKFVIQNSITFANNINLTITDLQGKQIYSNNIESINQAKIEVPLLLQNGFYLYKIISNEKEFTNKFEVVR